MQDETQSRGVSGTLALSLSSSHPQAALLFSPSPHFGGGTLIFSVLGGLAVRNVISVGSGHETKPCWCLN